MDEAKFGEIRAEIDKVIDGLPDRPSGIRMGFGLAGEFLARGLLDVVVVDMVICKWETRAYRGRYIYPEPMMGDYDIVFGDPAKS